MAENQGESATNARKRKKKRSFNQMSKKLARQRTYAGELESDTYQYIIRVLDIIRNEFPTMDDKLIFVKNVYEQTVGLEVDYAKNQVGSRVLESLLQYAEFDVIQRLLDSFKEDLRPMCSDRFASHVLEKLICVCADRGNRKKVSSKSTSKELKDVDFVKVEKDEKDKYNEMALKLCKYVINNMEEFVWDVYANHVLRAVIECLAGLIDKSEDQRKKKPGPCLESRRKVVQSYKDLLIESCTRIHKWPQFLEFGYDQLTSGLLQSILYSLKGVDSELSSIIIKKLMTKCFAWETEEALLKIFETESSARLIEACLAVADAECYSEIYKSYFAGKLGKLSLLPGANYCVQRLLDHCSTKEDFEVIFEEISTHFDKIWQKGYTGVLASTANACARLQAKQGSFVTSISKFLQCEEPEKLLKIARLAASLVTYEKLKEAKEQKKNLPVQLHGSLVVQAMLNFNKPIKIVNSILAADCEDLIFLFEDPKGSRIMDAFMDSKYIGEKSREKLARMLQGYWAQLACSTHGSRSLDKVWEKAKLCQKLVMMEELAQVGQSLQATKSGKVISAKLNVPLFVISKKEWSEMQGKEEKTKQLFADIIGP